jgi:hypothetical protein
MQPDNINPVARSPNINFSDDMMQLPIESLAFAAAILRLKRDDSIKPIIGKDRQLSQCLRVPSALRQAGCGFSAASFAVSGRFLGR